MPGAHAMVVSQDIAACASKAAQRTLTRLRLTNALCTVVLLLILSGCAAPWSLRWLNERDSYQELNHSALSGDTPSDGSLVVLRRHGLLGKWHTDPAGAIATLRAEVVGHPDKWPDLFALAELSYLRGRTERSQPDRLAAAVYAYAFLFPEDAHTGRPEPYDPQFRQACDIYNFALSDTLAPQGGRTPVDLASRVYDLPFGKLQMQFDQASLQGDSPLLPAFRPTYSLRIVGPQNIYHSPGLGAPFAAASQRHDNASSTGLQIVPKLLIPANALMTLKAPREQLATSAIHAVLRVHTILDAEDARIGSLTVPLEYDQTAARAISIVETAAWANEYRGFLNGTLLGKTARLVAVEPHRHGRRPVILVHGTASSPFRWADMVNDLIEDPQIRDNFEFWFFSYSSGNPIPYSALQLRRAINAAIEQLGGEETDPALGEMTVIGHSQGGLLAKMLVIDPGDRLWNGLSRRPLDALQLTNTSRELLRKTLFPHPIPEIRRVIFIATPHHGSYIAALSLSQLAGSLVRLPIDVTRTATEVLSGNGSNFLVDPSHRRVGSIYGMSPRSPLIRALASIPVVAGVHVHSIIPVKTAGPLAEGNDGVVRYSSAHIDGVDSERIVQSGHSTQSNPTTIAEVRRILLLQLATGTRPARALAEH